VREARLVIAEEGNDGFGASGGIRSALEHVSSQKVDREGARQRLGVLEISKRWTLSLFNIGK
jgi:hypothetical protein